MQRIFLLLLLFPFFFTACTVEPKPIEYGNDHCHFCDMTVVDKTHAAEYTTKKGKSYVFDAIECLVRDLNKNNSENKMAFILVSDYANPGHLTDAKTASFLISDKIKSPMGANLSGFSTLALGQKHLEEYGGKLYNWTELKNKFSK